MECNEDKMVDTQPERQIINELIWWTQNFEQVINREHYKKWTEKWWVVYRHNKNEKFVLLKNNGKI